MGLTRIRAQQISDIDYKQAVRVITLSDITLAGGAPSTVDGVSLIAGDRVLVNGQSNAAQNGLYVVQTLGTGSDGTWARTSDANENGEIQPGMIVMVTEGTTYADTPWKLVTNGSITIGVTELTFTENYSLAFGNIVANGTAVVANTVSGTVSFAAGANVSIVGNSTTRIITFDAIGGGTGGNLTVSSTPPVSPNQGDVWIDSDTAIQYVYFSDGDSSQWAEMQAYLTFSDSYGNTEVADYLPTYTGNLASLTGNVITTANVNASNVTATGNVSGGNLTTSGSVTTATVTATGNITGGNADITGEFSAGLVTGNLIPSANITYDLGNTTNRWNDLWLSNSTIHLGEVSISAAGGNLELPATIQIGNVTLSESGGNLALPAGTDIGGGQAASVGKAIAMSIVFGG